jgi:hypothetical protein
VSRSVEFAWVCLDPWSFVSFVQVPGGLFVFVLFPGGFIFVPGGLLYLSRNLVFWLMFVEVPVGLFVFV